MKTLRQHMLVLGALLGAAGFASGAAPTTTSVGQRPATFHQVSFLQMLDTAKGRKHVIDWSGYLNYGITAAPKPSDKPLSRTCGWLEGDFQISADGVDLWDVGAQHRTHQLQVRVVPKGGHTALIKQVTDSTGNALNPAVVVPTDANGFCLIEGSLPNGGTSVVNSYVIETNDPKLHLDVIFVGHPPSPGPITTFQTEDGGPPAVPPVHEN